jgi:uncharacterized damage-inducible protein DinB
MKIVFALLITALAAAPALVAQAPQAGAEPSAAETANPIVWSADQIYHRQAKFMIAAAEEMPVDKYTYRPTPDQWTFAKLISHVAQANGGVCGILSGTPTPADTKVAETASKEELVAAIKASFAFCDTAMTNLQDSQLSAQVTFFRGAHVPRARALFELTGDLEDHYSQMASYLRLNGLTPPSVQPRK